ncbi:MAG: GNAT family N-acetyltransferase [Pseudomonadota bacterium]
MFSWGNDPKYAAFCTVNKDLEAPPVFKSWQHLQQSLNSDKATRFGIYENNELVGEFNFVFEHPALLKSQPKTAWLGIGIGSEEFRGRGFGTKALEFLEIEVAKQGGRRIELGVFEFNHPAIRLYEKMNYSHFHTIPDFTYWQGRLWADLRFEKIL